MKKALLIGINKYPDSPLRGCVNDVLLMHKVLTSKYGFINKDIRLLTDKEATTKGIRDALKVFTTDVTDGDTLFFHYSGHGSQVVSTE